MSEPDLSPDDLVAFRQDIDGVPGQVQQTRRWAFDDLWAKHSTHPGYLVDANGNPLDKPSAPATPAPRATPTVPDGGQS